MTVSRRTAIPFFLLVAAWSSNAAAELTLTPSLSVREEYNDNIELTRDNRIDDFITTINPSLGISLKTSILELSADYGLNFSIFAKNSDRNETDLTEAQRAKVDTTLTLMPERLFLKVSDVFERVPIDERDQVAYDNIFVNLTNTNRLVVNPYLQYPITSTLMLNAGYTYDNVWYDDPEGDDSQSHMATVGLTQQFGDRLSVFGSYSYRWYRPEREQTQPYDSQTATIGAAVAVTPKLSVSGYFGRVRFDYDAVTLQVRIPVIDGTTGAVVGYLTGTTEKKAYSSSSAIWNAQANYTLTDRVKIGLGYSQSFSDSVDEGNVKNRTVTGSIGYDAKIPMSLSVFHTRAKYQLRDRQDESTGGVLSFGLPLTPEITLRVDGTYSYLTFEPDSEKVDRYGVRTGFDYQLLPRATVGVGYTYNRENSNVDENDYSNNIAFLQAKYTF